MTTAENILTMVPRLQAEFGKIDRVDPTGPAMTKLRARMDAIDNPDALRIIYAANIKWVSSLALTRLILRGEPVS